MKNIFLISLNSSRLTTLLDKTDITLPGEYQVDLFVFDTHETLNGLFFTTNSISEQDAKINYTISQIEGKIIAPVPNAGQLIRFSTVEKELKPYLSSVYTEYFLNNSFKRHCHSQIFQNLQPKLREKGIIDHRSHLIEIIVPFLLSEIAFYLFAFDRGVYNCAFGLESEMGILTDIKSGKYPTFSAFLNYSVDHQKISID